MIEIVRLQILLVDRNRLHSFRHRSLRKPILKILDSSKIRLILFYDKQTLITFPDSCSMPVGVVNFAIKPKTGRSFLKRCANFPACVLKSIHFVAQ